MAPGSDATVYLSSAPNQRFRGKVQGIGWAVKPEGEIDLPPSGVPYVKRELNWVRVAQRFPVRIEVENPDPRSFSHGRISRCDYRRSAPLNECAMQSQRHQREAQCRNQFRRLVLLNGSSASWHRRLNALAEQRLWSVPRFCA